MSDALFDDLERLYARLDEALPRVAGNPCGECNACCTVRGLNRHHVTALELDYIRARVGPERVDAFRRYAAREPGAADVCPYYDTAARGCSIHRHRPFSCRIFGHYRPAGTRLPAPCVFQGREIEFPAASFTRVVPEAAGLRDLARRHLLYRSGDPSFAPDPPPSGAASDTAPAEGDDAVERAAVLQARGEPEAALRELLAAHADGEPSAHLWYATGVVCEELDRATDALAAFEQAARMEPEAAAPRYHLGWNRLAAGDLSGAAVELRACVERNPRHVLALGLLAVMALQRGDAEEGAAWLARAREADPGFGRG